MKNLYVLFILVFCILFSATTAYAGYDEEVMPIMLSLSADMETLIEEIDNYMYNNTSEIVFRAKLENLEYYAASYIYEIINVNNNKYSDTIHIEIVNLISSWYTALDIINYGIKNEMPEQISAGMEILFYIGEKSTELAKILE